MKSLLALCSPIGCKFALDRMNVAHMCITCHYEINSIIAPYS